MKQSTRWASILVLAGCGTVSQYEPAQPLPPSAGVNQVWNLMAGTYTNNAQSKTDPEYKSMVLHMQPVWRDRTDGRWLYVEQAMQETAAKPTLQRVYQLVDHVDGIVEGREYDLPGDPLQYSGAWKLQNPLDQLLPSMLIPRTGCSVKLKSLSSDQWSGGSDKQSCESSLRGASYATCEMSLKAAEFTIWDRGFDRSGKQVWGSTKGPCVFKKQTQ